MNRVGPAQPAGAAGRTVQMGGIGWWAVPILLFLFLVVPGHPLSFAGGLPWGPLGLGCAVVLGLGIFAAWPLPNGRWVKPAALTALGLATLKLLLALTAPRYGFEATYYANDRFSGKSERSTSSPGTPYTRIDSALDFGGDEFPLYFFNNAERFNSLAPDRLERGKSLTWSVRWSGYLNAAEDGPATLWLTASGPAELTLDGKPLLKVDADGRATDQAQIGLSRGAHAVQVRYARKKERSGYLRLETEVDGQRRPLSPPLVTGQAYRPERLALDRAAIAAARAVDLAFLGLLAAALTLAVGRRLRAPLAPGESRRDRLERPLLALVPLSLFLHAALSRLDRVGKMVFLGGGQDWLTYETLARDIQLNGPLLTFGEPLGQGALLYWQPFYSYYLALLHTLSGEDLYGVITLQVTGLGVAAVLVYQLAARLFGRPTGLVALALMLGVLIPFELAWVARLLLSESLYFWLLPAALLALVALAAGRRDGERLAALAGLLLGLACLTRNPIVLYLPPAGLLLWKALRRRGLGGVEAARTLAVVGLCAGLLIGLMPLRNLIVAGKPALMTTSGGANLQRFHRPSDVVRLGNIQDDPLQQRLNVDRPTRETIEYVRQDPIGYLAACLSLAAYTLGVGSALNHLLDEEPVQLQPELLVLNALYLLALVLVPRARGLESGFLHALIVIHFLTMVVFAPYDYENRLVMPMYLAVTVFAAAAIVRSWQLGVRGWGMRVAAQRRRLPTREGRLDTA